MITFKINDMSCGHCKAAIEKAVTNLDSSATLEFDMGARKVRIESKAARESIQAALKAEGYASEVC
ncbi:heavy-metal-associated domain-containing protein [Leisingera aquaemixtae]|uniref:Copper chaperone CopZ n=1 Tax=Leisingera aquaemixtae TaxID=1396826 RepID=A0A0P1HUY0_9RHOB|nr:cation transporter [Leisingera aquaemixtae]CUH98375.1 Copper chaperone CopZ [Leisingera aquaemixtae]